MRYILGGLILATVVVLVGQTLALADGYVPVPQVQSISISQGG